MPITCKEEGCGHQATNPRTMKAHYDEFPSHRHRPAHTKPARGPRRSQARSRRQVIGPGPDVARTAAYLAAIALRVPVESATCIGCLCTEENACPGGCSWVLEGGTTQWGLCSRCFELLIEVRVTKGAGHDA